MARFKAGELDVLVATTVIEVGVDVPNATVMIVQEADRFGLAQLHQLRGRVGRGAEQSYCLLVSRAKEELTETAQARLQALVDTTDGFELAETDLELRGGGHLLGTRQSGVSDLRFAHLRRDRALLERARTAARELAGAPGRSRTRSTRSSRGRTSRRSRDVVLSWTGVRFSLAAAAAPVRAARACRTRSRPRPVRSRSSRRTPRRTSSRSSSRPGASARASRRVLIRAASSAPARLPSSRTRTTARCRCVDGRSLSVVDVLESFVEPRYTAASRDGRYAFVTDSGRIELATVDLARRKVVGRVKLSLWPRHLSLAPDGRTLWIGLGTASPRFVVVDVSQPERPRHVGTIVAAVPDARRRLRAWRPPCVGHLRLHADDRCL